MKNSEEIVLALCDGEAEYARLMTEYMERQGNLPWNLHTYTDVERMLREEKKVDILLVAETTYCEEIKSLQPSRLIILNESGIVKHKNFRHINKYQQADQVIRELMNVYLEVAVQVLPKMVSNRRTVFLGLYSPVGRCLQTSFALTMAQLLSQRYKTLYLNFEYFAGEQELLPEVNERDLADLLYFLNSEQPKFALRLQSMAHRIGSLDYIPPMKAGHNLLSVTAREWISFLKKIEETCEYDFVVMDLSECMQGLFDVLRACSRVFMITAEDRVANNKLLQYDRLLELYSYDDVRKKTTRCAIPRIKHLPVEIEYYTRGELADYARKQIEDLLKEIRNGSDDRPERSAGT